MTRLTYYRLALWLPLAVPVVSLVLALLVNSEKPEQTGLVGVAVALGFGLLAYAPFGVCLAYLIRRRHVSAAKLRRLGLMTPPAAGLLVALFILFAGTLEGNFVIGGGVLVGLITMTGGYVYVLLIEMIRVVGESNGLISGSDQREASGPEQIN